jgi:hypothetical protein
MKESKIALQDSQIIAERLQEMQRRQKQSPSPQRKRLIEYLQAALAIKQRQGCQGGVNLNAGNPNGTEALFAEAASKMGWSVTKRGWPDYLCWRDDELVAVEVKPEGHSPTVHQRLVADKLKRAGIKCFIWRPVSGFERM